MLQCQRCLQQHLLLQRWPCGAQEGTGSNGRLKKCKWGNRGTLQKQGERKRSVRGERRRASGFSHWAVSSVTTGIHVNSKQKFRCYTAWSFPESHVSVPLTSGGQHPLPETLPDLLHSQTLMTFLVQLMHVVTYGNSPAISVHGLLEYYMMHLQLYHVSVYIWVLHNQALTRKIITSISVIFSSALCEIISETE